MKRKMVSALLCATMVAGMVVVPAATAQAADKKLIGVTMPTKDLQRWNQDGDNMKKELEAAGYEVDLQYASNDVSTQVSQLENQVANGCDLLVVASIDGSSLGEPLKQAKEKGIPVISYDRLLMNSDAVTYYATFDNYKVGQKQGEYLVDALDLDNQDGPFNIELFTGDPGDNNCNFFFGGATGTVQKHRIEWILSSQVTTLTEQTLTQFSAPTIPQPLVLRMHWQLPTQENIRSLLVRTVTHQTLRTL